MNMLIQSAPLKGEYAEGYLRRLMILNAYDDIEMFEKAMKRNFNLEGTRKKDAPSAVLLSLMADISIEKFILSHTTLGIKHCYKSDSRPKLYVSGIMPRKDCQYALWADRKHFYFCEKCIKEDLIEHGHSYWRREHQMKGIYWCSNHQVNLRYAYEKSAICKTPATYLDDSESETVEMDIKVNENAILQKYTVMMHLLSNQAEPINYKKLSKRINFALNLKRQSWTYDNRNTPDIVKHIFDAFPKEWLTEVDDELFGIFEKKKQRILKVFSTEAAFFCFAPYILISAVLFDTLEEMIDNFTTSVASTKKNKAFKLTIVEK